MPVNEELFTDGGGGTPADIVYPGGYDTIFGSGLILPSGRDQTKGEDYTSDPSGNIVGERKSETLVGNYSTQPGTGADVADIPDFDGDADDTTPS